MAVDTTTFLADLKVVYGGIQEQVSTKAAFMNLLDKGPMDAPISNIGGRGYTFLARTGPNWRMGFRPEGTTGVGTAGNTGLAQATVTLTYAYAPIVITGQALTLSEGNYRAFMQARALEAKYDTADLISHINVVMVGAERGGVLAVVATSGAGTFTCDTTGNLPGAIYLRVGMYVDCAPTTGGTLTTTANLISAINYSSQTVTLTTADTCTVGQGIYLAGEASATTGAFPYTCEGLISLVSDSGARQGLNPATAAQTSWQSFVQNVGGADISSQSIDEQISFTETRSGATVDLGLFPMAQRNMLVRIATTTLRFETIQASDGGMGKRALDLGFKAYSYGGRTIVFDKDARPDRTFWGAAEAMRKFETLPLSLADDDAGAWTRLITSGSIADATGGLLRTYLQLGILQRSAWSMYYNYSIPPAFVTAPPTL